jgi:hypothetical protein
VGRIEEIMITHILKGWDPKTYLITAYPATNNLPVEGNKEGFDIAGYGGVRIRPLEVESGWISYELQASCGYVAFWMYHLKSSTGYWYPVDDRIKGNKAFANALNVNHVEITREN